MVYSVATFEADDARMRHARQIREDVFCHEQGVSAEIEWDGQDSACTHFLLFESENAIATARVRHYASDARKIERVAVVRTRRGTGAGLAIMRAILEFLARHEDPSTRILLHSQCTVAGFYERFGFIRQGEAFVEAGIPHVAMILNRPSG